MKKEREPRSKKQVFMLYVIAGIFAVAGFIAVFIPVILSDEQGHYEQGWIYVIVFLACMIAAVLILYSVMPDALLLDAERALKKYSEVSFTELNCMGKSEVLEVFQKHGFREKEKGFYRKKCFSLAKDSICYYVAFTDGEDIEITCENMLKRFNLIEEKAKNICFILFMYKAGVKKTDLEKIRNISTGFIIDETILPQKEYATMLPVLVDSQTGQGIYIPRDRGIAIYSYGSRILKKYLKRQK